MIAAIALTLLAAAAPEPAAPPAAAPAAPTATAPTSAADEAQAITVTGERMTDAAVEAGAQSYIRTVLPTPSYGQYARWADPICVKVSGIDDSYAILVKTRVLNAARAAKAPVGKPDCDPNLLVVFSEDAAATIGAIVRKKPKQLVKLSPAHRTALINEPLPVRWWHGIELRGPDGRPAAPGGSSALMSAQSAGGVPLANLLPADAPQTDSWSSSLINSQVAVWVTSAVVIVDISLANGKPLTAVSDYVAMVGLAPLKLPPTAPAVPSVLGLFGEATTTTTTATAASTSDTPIPGAIPALSDWDKAFLASLYRIQMNRKGDRQRGQLVTNITADLSR